MKTLLRGGLALAGAVLLTASAQAQIKIQIQPGPGGIQIQPAQPGLIAPIFNQNPLGLLENKDVQKDLKFSEEQLKKLGDLTKKFQDGLKDLPKGREGIQKRQELSNTIKKEGTDLLKGDQSKRLGQLEIQQKGINVFFDQKVVGDLNLTEEQKGKIREAIKDMSAKMVEIRKDLKGNREEIMKKTGEVAQAAVKEYVKGLTEEQRKKWQDLVGEPFQGVFPAQGLGGVIRPLPIEIQPRQPQPRQPQIQPRKVQPRIL